MNLHSKPFYRFRTGKSLFHGATHCGFHRHESEIERYLLSSTRTDRQRRWNFALFPFPSSPPPRRLPLNHSFPSLATSRIIEREPGEKLRSRPILGFRFFERSEYTRQILSNRRNEPQSLSRTGREIELPFQRRGARLSVSRVSRLSYYRNIVHPVRYHSQCARVTRQVDPLSNLIVE